MAQGHKLYFKKIELKNIKQKAPIIKSAYLKVLACAETLILKQVFIDEEVQFALPSLAQNLVIQDSQPGIEKLFEFTALLSLDYRGIL